MYCHACGIALTQQTKYCNRCGAQLVAPDQTGKLKRSEKRFDEYLDGLFWITVFGLGTILAGMVLMKKVGLSDLLILAYLVLSSAAFLVNFVINLRSALSIGKTSQELDTKTERQTHELDPAAQRAVLGPASSVTEHTTRSFERVKAPRAKPD